MLTNNQTIQKNMEKVPKFGVRHVMCILLYTFLACSSITRTTLSLAIVAMTDSSASSNPDVPTFEWEDTNIILSSFFWTYIVLQPFSGFLFLFFGLKLVILVTMLINGIAFLLIPVLSVQFGSGGLMACRLIQGLCQGFFFPAFHAAMGIWVPANERSSLSMVIAAGSNSGTILAMLVTGYICGSWWGWPAVYYILGAVTLIWSLLWCFLAADSPATHPRISAIERNYIESSLQTNEKEDHKQVPFIAILTSIPFWMILVANIGFSWSYTIIETEVPTYLHNVMGFDIESNGVLTASPHLVQLLITIPFGPLGDYLVSRKRVISLWTWRRLLHMSGSVLPAAALIWLSYLPKTQTTLAIVLLNVAIGTTSLMIFGSIMNHVDLSPRYAGVMYAIENSVSQGISMFAPIFIQYVVTDLSDVGLWRIVFLSLAGIMMVTAAFFVIFGTADIQWWNSGKRPGNKQELSQKL